MPEGLSPPPPRSAEARKLTGPRRARPAAAAAFAVPGITRVEIHHDRANLASRAVPARLGFTYVGEVPDQVDAPAEDGIDCIWSAAPGLIESW